MLRELRALCRQTVQVALRTGVDGYGEPTYGADVAHTARVAGRHRLVRDARGEQVLSTRTVYFAGAPALDVHDRVTLSTGDVGSTEEMVRRPALLDVQRLPDDLGGVSVVAYLA